jgi:hypothetical protein
MASSFAVFCPTNLALVLDDDLKEFYLFVLKEQEEKLYHGYGSGSGLNHARIRNTAVLVT